MEPRHAELYFAPNTCALAPHIALEEAGAAFETVRIDFTTDDQRKVPFLALNPKGRVPALATGRGVLTEVPAILAYIAQTYPAARLAPIDDPFAFAQAQAFNSYLCSTVHVAHAHRLRGYRWADDPAAHAAMQRKVPETVGACFALIEKDMFAGPWVLGNDYSICDAYLFTLAQWLEGDGVDIATLPKISDHHARMAERAAVRRALGAQTAKK